MSLGDLVPVPLPGQTVRLETDVQPILDRSCALSGCHVGSAPLALGMSLESSHIFTDVVGIASLEAFPTLLRIEPGRSDRSYLVNKIEGTQVQVGSQTDQMPPGGPFLSATEILLIREWIDQGALDN